MPASLTHAPAPSGQQILVLGMHRSGTSALARILGLMGAWIGDDEDLLPAHPTDNPTGYWERSDVVTAHDRFLAEVGRAWDRVAGFDWRQADPAARNELDARLRAIVAQVDAGDRPWLLKDPRLCLLLPAWRALLPNAAALVVVRDPREVAVSMLQSHRGVYTSHFLLSLWERYLRSLLADLAGERALFVSYADLLADPVAQCRRLRDGLADLGVDRLDLPGADVLEGFLDVRLKRSRAREHMRLDPAQDALYAWLCERCRAPGPVAVEQAPAAPLPDADLAEYERSADYQRERGHAEAIDAITGRLERLERDIEHEREWSAHLVAARDRGIAEARAETAAARAELDAVRGDLDEAEFRLVAATQLHDLHERRESMTQVHVRNLEAQVETLDTYAAQLAASVRALEGSLSWRLTRPLRSFAGWLGRGPIAAAEQALYRAYYAIPGISAARKRALVLALHRRLPWLTRHTQSYEIHTRTEELVRQRTSDPAERERLQRIDAAGAEALMATLPARPLISIAMPVYNVEPRWLHAAVESVRRQFYPHWELCLADDGSTSAATIQAVAEVEALGDARIRVARLPRNLGIAGATNAAVALGSGEWVGLLDNDDELTRDALLEVARTIVRDEPDLIYSDEDKLDEDGAHVEPFFKPDFSPDYLLSNNYVCHFSVLRRSLLDAIGGFRAGFDGAQDYDLILRASEQARRIAHIPQVLYHWRRVDGSTAMSATAKPETSLAGRRALTDALARRGIDGVAEPGPYPNTYRVRRRIAGSPLVSLLIPFRDRASLLRTCVLSVLERTRYAQFEIVGIDNGSVDPATRAVMDELAARDPRVRFVRHDAPFNYSALNNVGAAHARGEHLLLLNNDTEVISGEWLEAMLEHSQRPEVGVVGAQLLYADRRIQHAGVIIGLGGVAGHSHLMLAHGHPGYFARPRLIQNLSAVTFACAMTRRDVFERLGGLNETDLTVAFNDIDYCLRAREAGYLVVYTPYASLYHRESASRGSDVHADKRARFDAEIQYMKQRHAALFRHGDPYYNPHLSLSENFQPDYRYADALPL